MARTIRLLGQPSIELDGCPANGPRGRKSWALLAFVVLSQNPPSRRRLAGLLFGDADDPLGALRWSLAELRRTLGGGGIIEGDPIRLELDSDDVIDVKTLWAHQAPWLGPIDTTGELLEGMSFPGCPGFEAWLLVERRRHEAALCDLLRESGLAYLGAGRPFDAITLASRLVELDPHAEAHHALLVRAFASAGDRRAAELAARRCEQLFRDDLGVDPSPAVRAGLAASTTARSTPALTGASAARAQLAAGSAAISAGAVDAGLDCLRRSVNEARSCDQPDLVVESLVTLGSALIHSVRGRDEEGASVLHESVTRAEQIRSSLTATACRELGFIDVQAGRRDRANQWLDRARALAVERRDDSELASIDGVRGMSLSDSARYPEAVTALTDSRDRAMHAGNRKQAAWSASILGRLHLLRAEDDQADVALRQSLELVAAEHWIAFRPWPQSLAAELQQRSGNTATAEQQFSEAFALACELTDPCWEGMAARGLALLRAESDPSGALEWLIDARRRCVRWPDTYQWIHGYILDATCAIATDLDATLARRLAEELLRLAARSDMREFTVRGHLHRVRLGEIGADDAAAIAAGPIDSPYLLRNIDSARSPGTGDLSH
jgi:DNA-binding SARP family transcriptional activator